MSKTELKAADDATSMMMLATDGDDMLGFEETGTDSLAIPFLKLLQSGSKECKKGSSNVPGAAEGLWINTVSNEVIENPVVIPCYFRPRAIEWKPARGGFAGSHPLAKLSETTQEIRVEQGKEKRVNVLPNGNELVETHEHYVLIVDSDGYPTPAIISMSSSHLSVSKRWNSTQMQACKKAGMAKQAWRYTLGFESVEKNGDQWVVPKYSDGEKLDPTSTSDLELYKAAVEFAQSIRDGSVDNEAVAKGYESTVDKETGEVIDAESF